MGTLRSKTNHGGMIVNGVALGPTPPITSADLTQPQTIEDAWFIWDDGGIPSGEILEDGTIVPDGVPE